MQKLMGLSLVVLVVATSMTCGIVLADDISPGIRDTGKVYSHDRPDTSMFGTGSGAREEEASQLRFQVEREMQDGDWDNAIKHAKRAAQFDPGDPTTHFMLARALTKKFYTKKGEPDEKLLMECLYEWNLIWHHDADQWEQLEAKTESKRLTKVAKAIRKKHNEELAARIQAKEQLAKDRKEGAGKIAARPDGQAAADANSGTAKTTHTAAPAAGSGTKPATAGPTDDKSAASTTDSKSSDSTATSSTKTTRKKRFGLF